MAKILLRESEGKIVALHPEDGELMTRIENPAVWSDSSNLKTCYEHPEGIYFDSMESATEKLSGHIIEVD